MKFETTKLVNIYPTYPIVTITPPIRCPIKNVRKSIPEIRECIIKRAVVEEILEDGTVISLDFANYDKDNSKKETLEDLFKKEEKKEFVQPEYEDIQAPVEDVAEEVTETLAEEVVEELPVEEETVTEEVIETPVEEAVVEEPTAEAETVENTEEAVLEDDQYGL